MIYMLITHLNTLSSFFSINKMDIESSFYNKKRKRITNVKEKLMNMRACK